MSAIEIIGRDDEVLAVQVWVPDQATYVGVARALKAICGGLDNEFPEHAPHRWVDPGLR